MENRKNLTPEELIDMGYRRTSYKYGMISRIDRPDWVEYMAEQHAPWDPEGEGMRWVRALGAGSASDHYRRVYSQDKLELGRAKGQKIPTSGHDATGYIEVTK